ncbi:MAG: ATP-binding protein [Deltaproteobacteria bacterium]|jgi:predicted kinase|nr:ATP-binding protein [Deltaproteobacteria bacterium]
MPHNIHEKNCTPVLYVFFGMIATGKSTLAQAWARYKHIQYYNSDWVRKKLAGISPVESRRETVDSGIYTKEFTSKTYKALRDNTESMLKEGKSVILDASYQYTSDRQILRDLAKNLNCQLYFVLCRCPEPEMRERMEKRQKDPSAVSDGRWGIYLQQKKRFEFPDELTSSELIIIDTNAPLENLLEKLKKKLP